MAEMLKQVVKGAAKRVAGPVAEQVLKTGAGRETVAMSFLQGRLLVALMSVVSFWAAWEQWWAKVGPYLADGLTASEAMQALNSAGPMLSATNDMLIMAGAGLAFGVSLWSKAKDWFRAKKA